MLSVSFCLAAFEDRSVCYKSIQLMSDEPKTSQIIQGLIYITGLGGKEDAFQFYFNTPFIWPLGLEA